MAVHVIGSDGELVSQVLSRLDTATDFHFPGVKFILPGHVAGTRLVTEAEKELIGRFNLPLKELVQVPELPIMDDVDRFEARDLPPAKDLLAAWERCHVRGPQVQFHQHRSTLSDEASVGDVWVGIGSTIAALFQGSGALDGLPQHSLDPEGLNTVPWAFGCVYTPASKSGPTRTDLAFKYHIVDIPNSDVVYLVIEIKGPYQWWSRVKDIQQLINDVHFDIHTHLDDKDHAAHFIIQVWNQMLRYGVDLAVFGCVSGTYLFQRTGPQTLSVAGPYYFPPDPQARVDLAIETYITNAKAKPLAWSTFFKFVYLASRLAWPKLVESVYDHPCALPSPVVASDDADTSITLAHQSSPVSASVNIPWLRALGRAVGQLKDTLLRQWHEYELGRCELVWLRTEWALHPIPLLATLPIPKYYGLFTYCEYAVTMLSHEGQDLAKTSAPDNISTLLHDAVSKLRQVGIEPTDVSHLNVLWDGERLTLIDFVDPLCS
ncbi:hypothetical protein C8Q74DRAFT_1370559 [Fomes fomentarius]|nr:hypothetical protein C8Q74DRAFT_1370549 [Fomes fomentarius]KAI0767873.1 hypothetical protein C8Q74DRAFT_1370559 [Fomes fomentarius]